MDFANALYLTGAVFGVVTLAKVVFKVTDPRWIVLIVAVVSVLSTFAIAETVWADEQVIGGEELEDLDFWSKVVVAGFLAGAQTAVFLGLDAVKNIGQNKE